VNVGALERRAVLAAVARIGAWLHAEWAELLLVLREVLFFTKKKKIGGEKEKRGERVVSMQKAEEESFETRSCTLKRHRKRQIAGVSGNANVS
jgi:hypothetical protein